MRLVQRRHGPRGHLDAGATPSSFGRAPRGPTSGRAAARATLVAAWRGPSRSWGLGSTRGRVAKRLRSLGRHRRGPVRGARARPPTRPTSFVCTERRSPEEGRPSGGGGAARPPLFSFSFLCTGTARQARGIAAATPKKVRAFGSPDTPFRRVTPTAISASSGGGASGAVFPATEGATRRLRQQIEGDVPEAGRRAPRWCAGRAARRGLEFQDGVTARRRGERWPARGDRRGPPRTDRRKAPERASPRPYLHSRLIPLTPGSSLRPGKNRWNGGSREEKVVLARGTSHRALTPHLNTNAAGRGERNPSGPGACGRGHANRSPAGVPSPQGGFRDLLRADWLDLPRSTARGDLDIGGFYRDDPVASRPRDAGPSSARPPTSTSKRHPGAPW